MVTFREAMKYIIMCLTNLNIFLQENIGKSVGLLCRRVCILIVRDHKIDINN